MDPDGEPNNNILLARYEKCDNEQQVQEIIL